MLMYIYSKLLFIMDKRHVFFCKVFVFMIIFFDNYSINAQRTTDVGYLRKVWWSVEPIYVKPRSNKIMVNIGAQYNVSGDATGNAGAYLYSRINVSRFIFSGLFAMNPEMDYSIKEGTIVFCFKGKSNRKNGMDYDDERVAINFKTGGSHKIISPGKVTYTNVSYQTAYGATTNYYSNDAVYKVTTTTTKIENVKKRVKSYATLNVPKYTVSGLSLGVYDWKLHHDSAGIVNVQGFSFGIVTSINQKAKYKFNWEERINDVTVYGVGDYKETPTGKIRRKGSKIGRVNSTIDVVLEFLYAPIVNFQHNQQYITPLNDTIAQLKDIPKKYFGFRIRSEIRRGIFSIRNELGLRPGVKTKAGGEKGEDNFFTTKVLTGAYLVFGLGIGIGAW